MNGPGAAQPGGSLTGTLAQFFRRSGSLATGMVALEDRNIQIQVISNIYGGETGIRTLGTRMVHSISSFLTIPQDVLGVFH